MLRRETSHSYENKVGSTKFIVESECPESSQEDMMDALLSLLKKDIQNLSHRENVEKSSHKVIPFPEAGKTVSNDTKTR